MHAVKCMCVCVSCTQWLDVWVHVSGGGVGSFVLVSVSVQTKECDDHPSPASSARLTPPYAVSPSVRAGHFQTHFVPSGLSYTFTFLHSDRLSACLTYSHFPSVCRLSIPLLFIHRPSLFQPFPLYFLFYSLPSATSPLHGF